MERDEKIGTVKKLVQSLENNLNYLAFEHNHEMISSFSDYIFSRFFDKFTTLSINYIRINWLLETINFKQTESIVEDENLNVNYLEESDNELIATILRPLIELYLEIKSIQISLSANIEEDEKEILETFCSIIFHETNTSLNDLKLQVSKNFYNCEPKFYKIWRENNKKEVDRIKQEFSKKNIPILKKTINKFIDIVNLTKNKERLILGNDYLTTYALLSKKIHFSYTNLLGYDLKPKHLTEWCLLYFVVIYELIMDMLGKTDEIRDYLGPLTESLSEENQINNDKKQIGKVAVFDFGIAEITDFSDNKLKVKYLASNVFDKNTEDEIPKVFIKKVIDKDLFFDIKNKYYEDDTEITNDNKYVNFYFEIMKVEPTMNDKN